MQPIEPQEPAEHSEPSKARKAGGLGAIAAALGALALKFKGIFALLLQFKGAWTFIVTLWLYILAFGWRFGVVLVFLILAHELGHYAAFRAYGLPVRLPVFVPFLGAFTAGAQPADPEHGAYIALAGPLTGFGLAAACYALGAAFQDRFWFACASVGAFLNLFNMLPVQPFDGGRVIVNARMATNGRTMIFVWYAATIVGLAAVTWQSYSVAGRQ